MSPYQFQSEDFALSPTGVHLLRNGFNFKTIAYEDIRQASIQRSAEIRNAPVVLIIGILLVTFAFYQCRWVIELFEDPHTYQIDIETILLPFIPAALGIYCIYAALRRSPVLIVKEAGRTYRLRLRATVKESQTAEMERLLKTYLVSTLEIDPSVML